MNRIFRRVLPFVWILGVVVLVVSFVGAARTLDPNDSQTTAAGPARDESTTGVVCFGRVDVEGGYLSLWPPTFPQPNKVNQIHVSEGDEVVAGDLLIEFDEELAQFQLREAQAALREAQAKLAQVQKKADVAKETHDHLLRQQEAGYQARQAELNAAKARLQQLEDIQAKGLERGVTLTNKYEMEEARQKVNALSKAVEVERLKLEQLRDTEPDFSTGIDEAQAAVDRYQTLLEKAQYGLEQTKLTAPTDGVILRSLVREGMQFGPQTQHPALYLKPKGELIVRAEVEQEFAPRVKVGQVAKLYDATNTTARWTGTVTRIANSYLPSRSDSLMPNPLRSDDDRHLEFIVTLNTDSDSDQPKPLLGQKLRVSIGIE